MYQMKKTIIVLAFTASILSCRAQDKKLAPINKITLTDTQILKIDSAINLTTTILNTSSLPVNQVLSTESRLNNALAPLWQQVLSQMVSMAPAKKDSVKTPKNR